MAQTITQLTLAWLIATIEATRAGLAGNLAKTPVADWGATPVREVRNHEQDLHTAMQVLGDMLNVRGAFAASGIPAAPHLEQVPALILRDALLWAAGGLQAVGNELDTLRIGVEVRTVGQVLDAANAALEAPAMNAPAAPSLDLPNPDLWRDAEGLRGYTIDPGAGPWYTADTVRALLAAAKGA